MEDGYKIRQIMKTLRFIIMALVACAFLASCGDNNKENKPLDVTGQWELLDIQTKSVQIGDVPVEVFMEFKSDKTFTIWQKQGEGRHRKYTGTWVLTGNHMTGKYSDGKSWGAEYDVTVESGNLYMSETKKNMETYVYAKCTIPAELR